MKRMLALLLALLTLLCACARRTPEAVLTAAARELATADSFRLVTTLDADERFSLCVTTDYTAAPRRLRSETTLDAGLLGTFGAAVLVDGDDVYTGVGRAGSYHWSRSDGGDRSFSDYVNFETLAACFAVLRGFTETGTETLDGRPVTRYDGEIAPAQLAALLQALGLPSEPAEGASVPLTVWVDTKSDELIRLQAEAAPLARSLLHSLAGTVGELLAGDRVTVTVDVRDRGEVPPIALPADA